MIDEEWTNEIQCNRTVELSQDRCNPIATAALPRRKSGAMVGLEETEGLEVRFASEWRCEVHQVHEAEVGANFSFYLLVNVGSSAGGS